MKNVIGISRESADATEKRAPLTPAQAAQLRRDHDIRIVIQPSGSRIFADEEYAAAGATVSDDLTDCNVLFGINHVTLDRITPGAVYCFFSHTVKAQRYNLPVLRDLVDTGCTLLDYELVTDSTGGRVVYFGDYAGYAGLVDGLWALGKRLDHEKIDNPFSALKQASGYQSLEEAREALAAVGHRIREEGLPEAIAPLTCAFTGTGHVKEAARELFDLLPSVSLRPDDLPTLASSGSYSSNAVYGVDFKKRDLFEPLAPDTPFNAGEFDARPSMYRSRLHGYLPYLTLVVNGIYWSPRYPRLVTRDHVTGLFAGVDRRRLKVIADISCDIGGSIEVTVRHTTSEKPVYVFDPATGDTPDGFSGEGLVVLAVPTLAAELPRESSESFGGALLPYIPALARTDFTVPIEQLDVPDPFRKAIIVHAGRLTDNFRYLNEYLL